jgi:hypothetical protein
MNASVDGAPRPPSGGRGRFVIYLETLSIVPEPRTVVLWLLKASPT